MKGAQANNNGVTNDAAAFYKKIYLNTALTLTTSL